MCNDPHHAPDRIALSAAVLDDLENLTPAALKVYLYLCSRNQGQPFAASVPAICGATGLRPRSVIDGLKRLRDRQLVTRGAHKGSEPNVYGVPFKARKESAPPPAPKKATIPELVAACYRSLTDREFAELKAVEPDEAVLRAKLDGLRRHAGVAPHLGLGFFTMALQKYA